MISSTASNQEAKSMGSVLRDLTAQLDDWLLNGSETINKLLCIKVQSNDIIE